MPDWHFTAGDEANLLAGQAVSTAEAFLGGRGDVLTLARESDRLSGELLRLKTEPGASALVDVTRLLIVSMVRTAMATGARGERWAAVMQSFVSLLRHESSELGKGATRQ